MMTRLCLLLITCATLFAQRTPLKVNGTIVNNPNLTNSASVTYTVNGANVSAAATAAGGVVGTVINTGASTVGQLAVYNDTTGTNINASSGVTNLTLVAPTIADFSTATHNHQNNAGGGVLDAAAISSGVLGSARLGAGGAYHGAILTPWVGTDNSVTLQWKKPPQVWEFVGNSAGEWTTISVNSGVATVPTQPTDGVDPGGGIFNTGSLTNGVAGIRGAVGVMSFTTNNMALMTRIFSPSILSTDADGYEMIVGFGDVAADSEPTDGAYFYYIHSVSNGVWTAKTSANSVRSFATGAPTTPPAVATSRWYNLLIEANKDTVNFWVSSDDGSTWQWIGASSSNIPNTAGTRVFGIETYIRKVGGSVGTGSRVMSLGRIELWPNRGN